MNDSTLTTPAVSLDDTRSCTRCDGNQFLVASEKGMGTYRCDTCSMVVGFDLEDQPAEFLVDRGLAARYTRRVFGERLTRDERRLGV